MSALTAQANADAHLAGSSKHLGALTSVTLAAKLWLDRGLLGFPIPAPLG